MEEQLKKDLGAAIHPDITDDLIHSYIDLVSRYRKHDLDGCLSASGKFVENTLRAIEFIRTKKMLPEIKKAAKTRTDIENDTSLPESLRILVPRVAMAMVYDVRSKTGAVHVKEIDPRPIDASLAVHAASWVLAEFVRLFHSSNESVVQATMDRLMRTYTPFIEAFGDEEVVTHDVSCELELLLLLANAAPAGLTRTEIGRASQFDSSMVSRKLKALASARYVYKARDDRHHITGPGEKRTADLLGDL